MPSVSLDDQEWQQVMAMIAERPWREANPLLMKIGRQLQQEQQPTLAERIMRGKGDGKEATHE